jgi:hypothetical protein
MLMGSTIQFKDPDLVEKFNKESTSMKDGQDERCLLSTVGLVGLSPISKLDFAEANRSPDDFASVCGVFGFSMTVVLGESIGDSTSSDSNLKGEMLDGYYNVGYGMDGSHMPPRNMGMDVGSNMFATQKPYHDNNLPSQGFPALTISRQSVVFLDFL